jgi:hypothetical protein
VDPFAESDYKITTWNASVSLELERIVPRLGKRIPGYRGRVSFEAPGQGVRGRKLKKTQRLERAGADPELGKSASLGSGPRLASPRGREGHGVSTGLRKTSLNNCFEGLTKPEKLLSLPMVRELRGAEDCSGASQSDRRSLAREKAKARSRSYSGVLYEYRVERSRATRGATPKWVVAPGARRRVFYFAVVISGSGEWEEVPQGISEASRRATKTRSKIPGEAGESWKASSR